MAMLISKFHRLIQSRLLWAAFLVIVVISFVFWGSTMPKTSQADLEKSAGLALGFHHVAGVIDGVGHHLLAIHRLASLESQTGEGRVEEVRRGDEHAVEVLFLGQHLLDLGVFSHRTVGVFDAGSDAAALHREDVANGGELNAGDVLGGTEKTLALGTATNERDFQDAVG